MRGYRFVALVAVVTVGTAAPAYAQGPRVGHRVESLTVPGSTLCPDPVPVNCQENRQVKVHLWYPAAESGFASATRTEYTSALYGRQLAPEAGDPLGWTVQAEIARETGAVDPNGGPFPVIVFSHGSTNDPIDYAHTLERIAAAGYVVAAPAHVNNTQDDVRIDFVNGLTPANSPLRIPCNDGRPSSCSRRRPRVQHGGSRERPRHMLDALPGWFGNRVDPARVGVLGHSAARVTALAAAGGSTTWGSRPRTSRAGGHGHGDRRHERHDRREPHERAGPDVPRRGRAGPQLVPVGQRVRADADPEPPTSVPGAPVGDAPHVRLDVLRRAAVGGRDGAGEPERDARPHTSGSSRPRRRAGISGKAINYCARSFFTTPVDIGPLVASTAGAGRPS